MTLAPGAALASDEIDYFPLSEGSEWTMNAVIISSNGKRVLTTARRRIEGKIDQDGKSYHRMRTWMEGGPAPFEMVKLIRKDAAGVYSMEEQKEGAKEEIEILLPLKVGQKWKDGESPATVIGVENITIDGKTFEGCYHIRITSADGRFTEDYYEAPKVGSVKSTTVFRSGVTVTLTLSEFKSGK